MSPSEFQSARRGLGLTQARCAELFRVDLRTIQKWEGGEREIPGPAEVLMRWLATGKRPKLPK